MESLHLPRGGRGAGLGVAGDDAVLSADPFEHDLARTGLGESSGELLAIVCEDFVGDPEALQRLNKRCTHGPAGGPTHHGGDHAEPGMVVHAGHHLDLGAVGQLASADDVELPRSIGTARCHRL